MASARVRILLLGGDGQLGKEICKRIELDPAATPSIGELDITNTSALQVYIRNFSPEVIVNCAAYTAVDKAESEVQLARDVNAIAVGVMAREAARLGARLLHVSTDYVFGLSNCFGPHEDTQSGDSSQQNDVQGGFRPLTERDPVSPLNQYGRTKREGEILAQYCPQATVLRTSSVHGQFGPNFVHTMLKLFAERSEVRVVNNQYMSPTWAGWLAEQLIQLAETRVQLPTILHCCGRGVTTWFDFAAEILRLVRSSLPGAGPSLIPIPAAQYPTPARRPVYSVLDSTLFCSTLNVRQISWHEGLRQHLTDIGRLEV
jgi:dTDP-4-dehydrorhamnose reductase